MTIIDMIAISVLTAIAPVIAFLLYLFVSEWFLSFELNRAFNTAKRDAAQFKLRQYISLYPHKKLIVDRYYIIFNIEISKRLHLNLDWSILGNQQNYNKNFLKNNVYCPKILENYK